MLAVCKHANLQTAEAWCKVCQCLVRKSLVPAQARGSFNRAGTCSARLQNGQRMHWTWSHLAYVASIDYDGQTRQKEASWRNTQKGV